MPYLSVNGRTAEQGRLCLPRTGVWRAEVVVQGRLFDARTVSISLAGALLLRGTVREGGSGGNTKDATHLLVVGGAGGLAKTAEAQHFREVPLRIPLERVLKDAGEELSPASTESFLAEELPHWVTMAEPTARVVKSLAEAVGAAWRVMTDGRVWVGEETWPAMPSVGYSVLHEWPLNRQARLVVDAPLFLPGFTLRQRKISMVEYNVSAERLTCDLWFEP